MAILHDTVTMNTGTGIGFRDGLDPSNFLEAIPESEKTWREKQALKAARLAQEALVRLQANTAVTSVSAKINKSAEGRFLPHCPSSYHNGWQYCLFFYTDTQIGTASQSAASVKHSTSKAQEQCLAEWL
jgi:hypothetical protein